MPRFHHVNLGVPPGGLQAEMDFLVDLLGYRRVDPPASMQSMNINWFEADDGSQVHLSEDPEHQAAARAHTAIEFGDELDAMQARLDASSWKYTASDANPGLRVLFIKDPSGNRWELRGVSA